VGGRKTKKTVCEVAHAKYLEVRGRVKTTKGMKGRVFAGGSKRIRAIDAEF